MLTSRLSGLLQESVKTPGVAAMLLALTRSIHDEEIVKEAIAETGHRFVVTEVGGQTGMSDFQEKINRAVIGAGLNKDVIAKLPNEVHAIIHAAEEAKRGIMINTSSSASVALKIAVVRDDHWIAVAMFGTSAIYYMTNHERAGLGVMHI